MPISADRFEEISEEGPPPETNAETVLSFLERHPDKAFTRGEIADATEIAEGSIGPTLVRLREAGRVDHRGRYWRVSDHDRSLDETPAHATAVAESHEDEPFDYDEWRQHAVDPRDTRE